eukprot:2275891-Alexandrium_andersonii.AAC.1
MDQELGPNSMRALRLRTQRAGASGSGHLVRVLGNVQVPQTLWATGQVKLQSLGKGPHGACTRRA